MGRIFDPSKVVYLSFSEGLLRIALTFPFLEGLNVVRWAEENDDWIEEINFYEAAENRGESPNEVTLLLHSLAREVIEAAGFFVYLLIDLINF